MAAKANIQETITNRIVEAIEAGTPPWRNPWTGNGSATAIPLRFNGVEYRGINTLMLWLAANENDFSSARWMTFKQAKDLGGKVKKGSKSTQVVKYGTFAKEDENGKEKQIPYLKGYNVFNADQIEGLPAEYYIKSEPAEDLGTEPVAELEDFFASTGANIKTTDKPRAYYSPREDFVHMPPINTFYDASSYYGVLAHELVHWTGNGLRLDRLKKFGNREDYAFEELVAEIGSCILAAQLGVEPDFDQSAAYVEGWLNALKNDQRLIFKAASEAQKAVDFILEAAAPKAEAA